MLLCRAEDFEDGYGELIPELVMVFMIWHYRVRLSSYCLAKCHQRVFTI
jgi:hypothetical protein